ncbi:MAG: hypothetical protein ABSB49_21595 [Polyangia bacterium]|jgi:hypothetical protein
MAEADQSAPGADPRLSRTARRRDDAARFIERFAALTGYQISSTSAEGLPRQFLARTVEPPEGLVRQYGYELEPRTHNALCRYEPGRNGDRWTFGRLLEIRGFGVFSLLDLLEVLAKHGISYRS